MMMMMIYTELPQLLVTSIHCALKHGRICTSARAAGSQPVWPRDRTDVKECYKVLGVSDESSNDEVKEAYLRLAKQFHPDSGSQASNAGTFVDIDNAYRRVMNHRRETGTAPQESEEVVFDIKHTAPQHRQYLTFEGVGYGSPSQRQHQYQQKKVMTAVDTVFEYRTQRISALYENSMVTKDKRETKKRVIRSAIDRLVEDLIAESMARGEFDNLPGTGKPLPYTNHNPYIDATTHNLNRILINNGYVPEWVTLEKDIRQMVKMARDELLQTRVKARHNWSRKIVEFRQTIDSVNLKINKLNMVVPTLRQQMAHYDAGKELDRIVRHCEELQKNSSATNSSVSPTISSFACDRLNEKGEESNICSGLVQPEDKLTLRTVLKEIKAIFSGT